MKFNHNKKYFTISVYVVCTFGVCLLLLLSTMRYQGLLAGFKKIFSVLTPIIWGMVIAYILNPMMMFIESHLPPKIKSIKARRGISVAGAMTVGLAVLAALSAIILPQIVNSILSIYNNLNTYFATLQEWIDGLNVSYPQLQDFINLQVDNLESLVMSFIRQPNLQAFIRNITTGAVNGVFSFLGGVWDFLLGLMVTVYLLAGKETFKAQAKKIMYAIFPEKICRNTISISRMANSTFIGFISGKSLDSLIIGIICFVALAVMRMPYAVLIAVIIGITNMIPFFGPIIGAIPSGLLILLSSPNKILLFVIFVIALQQFDGNILGPKILGNSTGLPPFWVMFAIFVGGGLFGFVGMLVGVPVFAVVYALSRQFVSTRLKRKNMPISTESYSHPISESKSTWEEELCPIPTEQEVKDNMEKSKKIAQLSRKNNSIIRKNSKDDTLVNIENKLDPPSGEELSEKEKKSD